MTEQLTIKDLSIGYDEYNPLIEEINATVTDGKIVAILGRNGTGKSTLIRTISGLMEPLRGRIKLGGDDLSDINHLQRAKQISVVLTNQSFVGNLKAGELIRFGRYPFTGRLGIEKDEDKAQISKAVKLCNVRQYLDRRLDELSDGERQKVMLTRCIAQNTGLVCLDEPTSHLDISNKIEVYKLIQSLKKNGRISFIYSSHDVFSALKYADEIWLINKGRIITGNPEFFREGKLLAESMEVPMEDLGII